MPYKGFNIDNYSGMHCKLGALLILIRYPSYPCRGCHLSLSMSVASQPQILTLPLFQTHSRSFVCSLWGLLCILVGGLLFAYWTMDLGHLDDLRRFPLVTVVSPLGLRASCPSFRRFSRLIMMFACLRKKWSSWLLCTRRPSKHL